MHTGLMVCGHNIYFCFFFIIFAAHHDLIKMLFINTNLFFTFVESCSLWYRTEIY